MAQPILIDDRLWVELAQAARKRRQQPEALVVELIHEYLEMESDEALFEEMREDLAGDEMTDGEAVELVHKARRDRR